MRLARTCASALIFLTACPSFASTDDAVTRAGALWRCAALAEIVGTADLRQQLSSLLDAASAASVQARVAGVIDPGQLTDGTLRWAGKLDSVSDDFLIGAGFGAAVAAQLDYLQLKVQPQSGESFAQSVAHLARDEYDHQNCGVLANH